MKKVAIVYSSKYGQTEKIAGFIGEYLTKMGVSAIEYALSEDSDQLLDPAIDGIILGAPVYAGLFPRALVNWTVKNRPKLERLPSAFFSVSLNVADSKPEARLADDDLLRLFLRDTKWCPQFVASLAGALKYTKYNCLIRRVMRKIAKSAQGPTNTDQDFELTNWKEVESFVESFVNNQNSSRFAIDIRLSKERWLLEIMPQYEQTWTGRIRVQSSPEKVFHALKYMNPNEMKLAQVLTWIRTFAKAGFKDEAESFSASAEKFGVVGLDESPPSEMTGGLVGRFWGLLGTGIKLYMRSIFSTVKRTAEQRTGQQNQTQDLTSQLKHGDTYGNL
ncbi:MAG: flavodoxin domain-containing protein [Bdellovibrionales bacterium]